MVVSGVRAGDGKAFGSRINVTGVQPNVSQVIAIKWKHGGPQIPAELGSDGAFVGNVVRQLATTCTSARRCRC